MFIKRKDNARQIERKLQKAGALLGFSKHQAVSADMVRARFVEMVKHAHPDTVLVKARQQGINSALIQLDAIRKAKDFILKHMEDDDV